jgi:hypothetical protein
MAQEGKPDTSAHEPFVPQADRPAVKPDTRLSDITVQDLLGVLHGDDTFKPHNYPLLKPYYVKEVYSKAENYKFEHWKLEHIKIEIYKIEHVDIPIGQTGPIPEFAQLAQGIEGLRAQMLNLSSEVAALRKSATT